MDILVGGYMYPFVSQEVLNATLPNLSFLALFTYGITEEGELIQLDDEALIEAANANGVIPIMVLTAMNVEGRFDTQLAHIVLNNADSRERLVENILNNIKTKGLGGVDFDFEFLFPEDRETYASFVDQTRQRLNPEGYMVTVALAPKTYAEQPGLLYEGHDYALMGQAANLTLLMTYEWGYKFGPPMAVAPVNMVRRVLDFAVTQIPREKILMGIPNYGYDWTLPFVENVSMAELISNIEAVERAERVGAVIQYDQLAETPFYTYQDPFGNEHEVWFENEASLRAKLSLVAEYGLGGVSYWNLMDYHPVNWVVLHSMYGVRRLNSPADVF
ncbi:MAG TPA: glycosyl hydrolase family 18 protein [Anaerovoracaceae bacterium]|nr:glycosyl hydrolase family 18 protein [Anaerovoracaceae bacterium]